MDWIQTFGNIIKAQETKPRVKSNKKRKEIKDRCATVHVIYLDNICKLKKKKKHFGSLDGIFVHFL